MYDVTVSIATTVPVEHDVNYYAAYSVFLLFAFLLILYTVFKTLLFVERNIYKLSRRRRPEYRRDTSRVFTARQKRAAGEQCHWRCEGTGVFHRCRYTGKDLHGDHWYPYARGGATNMQNLVMLCPACNRRKTDKIPSFLQTKALSYRRKHNPDYEQQITKKPGYWLPRTYRRTGF